MTIECQARAAAPRSAPRMQRATLRRSGRLDVGVETEQVRRIVASLERGEPRVVVAIGRVHAGLAIIGAGEVDVVAPCVRLELRPGAAHPRGARLRAIARDLPEREREQRVTRTAPEERGV